MFEIEIKDLHWLEGVEEAEDPCLHGRLRVTIGAMVWDDEGCVSAGALQLLRSIHQDRSIGEPAGLQMLPCCGHGMFPGDLPDTVLIIGCGNGLDFAVTHEGDGVRLSAQGNTAVRVPQAVYRREVYAFADAVEARYTASTPKRLPEDDAQARGYRAFWREWRHLRGGKPPVNERA